MATKKPVIIDGNIHVVNAKTDNLKRIAGVINSETKARLLAAIADGGAAGVNAGSLIGKKELGNLKQSHLSSKLRDLRKAGLVNSARVGKNQKYTISKAGLASIRKILQGVAEN